MNEITDRKLSKYELPSVIDIESISTMFIYTFDKDYKGFEEHHKELELIYVVSGSEIVKEDGIEYTLNQGEAFLHKSESIHSDHTNNTNSKVYILSFISESEKFSNLFNKVIRLNSNEIFMLNEVFDLSSKYFKNDKEQMSLSSQFFLSDDENTPFGLSQIIKNKLELFFIEVISNSLKTNKKTKKSYDPLTKSIIDILEITKYEKFSLDEISEKLLYSKSYLCRHFKTNMGVTISKYFFNLKINEAKKFLLQSNLAIKDISVKLNFDSVQYFSSTFKKITGVSPAAWRKEFSKKKYF